MIYGYDGFSIQWLSGSYFNSQSRYGNYKFDLVGTAPWQVREHYNFRMHDGSEAHRWLSTPRYGKEVTFADLDIIKQKLYVPSPGDTLFFDKACTIPRIKCEGTWKRSIRIAKADTVVIPDNTPPIYSYDVALFLNTTRHTISILRDLDKSVVQPVVGQSFDEWHELAKSAVNRESLNYPSNQEAVRQIASSVCIFVGELFAYRQKDQWLFDVFDGIYPKITQEGTLLQLLGSEEERFTPDFVEGLIELLNSKDRDSVHQGMRVLANMDYTHYPSVTKYILQRTKSNWDKHKPYNSAVKFMLNSLGQYHNSFTDVTPEEFFIAHDILVAITRDEINQHISRIRANTNLIVDIDYSLELRLPEEPSSNDVTGEAEDDSELA